MGRPKRIQFPGACYLVELRGAQGHRLFLSSHDRRQFLALLRQHKERYGLAVYAYALSDAAVHLLVETPQANLAVVMQGLNTRYTKYFNSAHNAAGQVLAGRYKAYVVDKDSQLAEVSRYVHLACAREGAREKPWRNPWSSCAAYAEARHKEPLVDSDAVLRGFGRSRLMQSARYLLYLKERLRAFQAPDLPIVGGVAIGGLDFLARLGAHGAPAPAVRPSLEAARRIVAELAVERGLSEEKLLGRLQWRELADARREAVRRIWTRTRMGVSDMARLFQRTPSAISQTLRLVDGEGSKKH